MIITTLRGKFISLEISTKIIASVNLNIYKFKIAFSYSSLSKSINIHLLNEFITHQFFHHHCLFSQYVSIKV